MNRANMSKQITEVPMAGCKSKKGFVEGGRVATGRKKTSGADQSQCSQRKLAAMGKMAGGKKA